MLASMDLESLIETHGYWVLLIGCLLEGETMLVMAGFAAHSGYLDPFVVVAVAAIAAFIGSQFFHCACLASWQCSSRPLAVTGGTE